MSDHPTADLDAVVRAALVDVAPDLEGTTIDADADLHEDLGLDSMDALNFAIALHEATGVDVPERDAGHLRTIGDTVAYLRARML
ncbi:MAG: acyl carrier protein [Acidimicrobiia bacterium]